MTATESAQFRYESYGKDWARALSALRGEIAFARSCGVGGRLWTREVPKGERALHIYNVMRLEPVLTEMERLAAQ